MGRGFRGRGRFGHGGPGALFARRWDWAKAERKCWCRRSPRPSPRRPSWPPDAGRDSPTWMRKPCCSISGGRRSAHPQTHRRAAPGASLRAAVPRWPNWRSWRAGAACSCCRMPARRMAREAGGPPFTRFSPAVAYSFYPTKNLPCLGDGGAVLTDSRAVAAAACACLRDGGRPQRPGEPHSRREFAAGRNAGLLPAGVPAQAGRMECRPRAPRVALRPGPRRLPRSAPGGPRRGLGLPPLCGARGAPRQACGSTWRSTAS